MMEVVAIARDQSHDGVGCLGFSATGLAHNGQSFTFLQLKGYTIHRFCGFVEPDFKMGAKVLNV